MGPMAKDYIRAEIESACFLKVRLLGSYHFDHERWLKAWQGRA